MHEIYDKCVATVKFIKLDACGEDMILLSFTIKQMGKTRLCPTNLWRLATPLVLVGIISSGVNAYVSPAYEGCIPDKKLVEVCGILEKLECGDEIMGDKGFHIQDLLAPLGVHLNIPSFLNSITQMPVNDVLLTRKIAHLRIHVERAIGWVQHFWILQHTLPTSMWD